MNWSEIGTQVILGIIGVVISGLGALITYLINNPSFCAYSFL